MPAVAIIVDSASGCFDRGRHSFAGADSRAAAVTGNGLSGVGLARGRRSASQLLQTDCATACPVELALAWRALESLATALSS